MKLTIEPAYRIYNDEDRSYYEVRMDRDGLGCVEVVYNEGNKGSGDQAPGVMSPEVAIKVAECLVTCAKFRQEHPL